MEPPPPTLKASGTLSEKESQEVEVISKVPLATILYMTNDIQNY